MVEPGKLDEIFRIADKESANDGREAHVAELLSRYVEFRPEHAKAWMLYGDALRVLGRKGESLLALTRAFELASQENKGYVAVRIAMLLEKHSSPLEAKEWYETATNSIGSDEGWMWILRGANLSTLGEFPEAIECFETVVMQRADEKDEALLNLGLVARALGNYEKAREHFRAALAVSPNYKDAKSALLGLDGMPETLELVKELNVTTLH